MIIYNYFDDFKIDSACVIAIGDFDGVHQGHQKLILSAYNYAKKHNALLGVYTFKNNGKNELSNKFSNTLLTTNEEKEHIISKLKPDFLYYENFNDIKDFAPDKFSQFIIEKFNCICMFCGENFRYGKNASGTVAHLCTFNKKFDCDTVAVELYSDSYGEISSTRIRNLIYKGDVEKASVILGKQYSFTSEIVHGNSLGHTIGFPTINQIIPDIKVIPAFGVYATKVEIDGQEFFAVSNVGVKPTIDENNRFVSCETHIIDFKSDIYGKYAKITFYKKLRDELKFSSIHQLQTSIKKDVINSISYFRGNGNENSL